MEYIRLFNLLVLLVAFYLNLSVMLGESKGNDRWFSWQILLLWAYIVIDTGLGFLE